jgi:hypothetical protein
VGLERQGVTTRLHFPHAHHLPVTPLLRALPTYLPQYKYNPLQSRPRHLAFLLLQPQPWVVTPRPRPCRPSSSATPSPHLLAAAAAPPLLPPLLPSLLPPRAQVFASASGHPDNPLMASPKYMRDRVGVPRDMRFPAARQLRAHLNHLIDQLHQA